MTPDVTVVGGGLTGLCAAVLLARQGQRVALLEQSSRWGGRGATETDGGFSRNLGPHALFRKSEAERVLLSLGLRWSSGDPSSRPNFLQESGRLHRSPNGPGALLATDLLTWKEKWGAGQFFATLPRRDLTALADIPLAQWTASELPVPRLRTLVEALVRVGAYTDAADRLSAGAGLAQLQAAFPGVRYVDGGWQTLVSGLETLAKQAGVVLMPRAKVVRVEHQGSVRALTLASGEALETRGALLCVGPEEAAALTGVASLQRFAATAVPVRMATLDVALSALPHPEPTVCFALDAPLYFSVHSAVAKLAPPGAALLHVSRYLPLIPAPDEGEVRGQLERFLDSLQPGWRERVVHARFLPHVTVMHAAALASQHGLKGRPPARVAEVEGLAIAGDWVGPRGMLLDACLLSAEEAVRALANGCVLQARGWASTGGWVDADRLRSRASR